MQGSLVGLRGSPRQRQPVTHIDLEFARGAAEAPFAEQHTELRVDVRAAASIVERLAAARGAVAQDRHGARLNTVYWLPAACVLLCSV